MITIAVKKSFDEDLYFDGKWYVLKGCITGIVNRTPQHVDWHNPDNSYPGEEDVDDKSVRTELECFEIDEDGYEKEIPVPAFVLDHAMDMFYTSYEEE